MNTYVEPRLLRSEGAPPARPMASHRLVASSMGDAAWVGPRKRSVVLWVLLTRLPYALLAAGLFASWSFEGAGWIALRLVLFTLQIPLVLFGTTWGRMLVRWVTWRGLSSKARLVRGTNIRMVVFDQEVESKKARVALALLMLLPFILLLPIGAASSALMIVLVFVLPLTCLGWFIATLLQLGAIKVLELRELGEEVELGELDPFALDDLLFERKIVLHAQRQDAEECVAKLEDPGGGFPRAAGLFLLAPNGRRVLESAGLSLREQAERGGQHV